MTADIIRDWGDKYGIYSDLVDELIENLVHSTLPQNVTGAQLLSEAGVQQKVRLDAAAAGMLLWRNNSGVGLDEEGKRTNRYGLCNDSAALNARIKSADLIGIKPVLITPDMVGTTIGQFMARECKPANWKFTGTERETAQQAFLILVNARGGDGKFSIGGL